jgi:hypothetical protein
MKRILFMALPVFAAAGETISGGGAPADSKPGDKAKAKQSNRAAEVAAKDDKMAAPKDQKAAAAKAELPADDGEKITVFCPLASGRRRAGRRWPAGKTTVPASELSEADMKALIADTYLTVTPAEFQADD